MFGAGVNATGMGINRQGVHRVSGYKAWLTALVLNQIG